MNNTSSATWYRIFIKIRPVLFKIYFMRYENGCSGWHYTDEAYCAHKNKCTDTSQTPYGWNSCLHGRQGKSIKCAFSPGALRHDSWSARKTLVPTVFAETLSGNGFVGRMHLPGSARPVQCYYCVSCKSQSIVMFLCIMAYRLMSSWVLLYEVAYCSNIWLMLNAGHENIFYFSHFMPPWEIFCATYR